MKSVRLRSWAKINLGLKIAGLRPDGFHELRTVFQTIALYDDIDIALAAGSGIRLDCAPARETPRRAALAHVFGSLPQAWLQVPSGDSNLVWKAAALAIEHFRLRGQVRITLRKRIPTQSGLGGGSGNAAVVLHWLASQARRRPSPAQLWTLGTQLGSDVAPFLIGGTALGLGRGDECYALPDLPAWPCVLVRPRLGVETAGAFRRWDELHPSVAAGAIPGLTSSPGLATIYSFCSSDIQALPASRLGRDRDPELPGSKVRAGIENDFEEVVFPLSPDFARIKRTLLRAGAFWASLSGSGAALYGLFAEPAQAHAAAEKLGGRDVAWLTRLAPRRLARPAGPR